MAHVTMPSTNDVFSNGSIPTTAPVASSVVTADYTTTAPTASSVLTADYTTIRTAYFYLMAIVICSGLVANTLAIWVLSFYAKLRETVSGHYLLALAVADSIFLLGDFIRWLNPTYTNAFHMGVDFMHTNSAVCKIVHFLRYSGKFASSWLTVAITLQRLLAVAKPLQTGLFSTTFRVKLVIALIVTIGVILNAFPFWLFDTIKLPHRGKFVCGYKSKNTYHHWNLIILQIGSLYIPGVLILNFTITLAFLLVKMKKARNRNRTETDGRSNSNAESHLSAMLVAVAVAFLVLRIPYAVTYKINDYKASIFQPLDPETAYSIYSAYKITDVIATSNYGINFVLYCLCCSIFRAYFVQLFCKQRGLRKTTPTSVSTQSAISLATV